MNSVSDGPIFDSAPPGGPSLFSEVRILKGLRVALGVSAVDKGLIDSQFRQKTEELLALRKDEARTIKEVRCFWGLLRLEKSLGRSSQPR
jgi:hypothetical protein